MEKKKIPLLILLILYGLIGYSPYFEAVDQVGPQWVLLTIFNITALFSFLFLKDSPINEIFNAFKKPIVIALVLFAFWGLLSYTYSINPNEVIVKSSQWFNVIISIPLIYLLIKKAEINFYTISLIISFFLFVEVFVSMSQYIEIISLRNYNFSLASMIKGVTGNKNITSASIAVKAPFLIYAFWKTRNKFFSFILIGLLTVTYFNLILLSSRSIYVSIISINLILIIFYLIKLFLKSKININRNNLLSVLGAFLISICFSFISLGRDNSALITKRIQTINTSDESTQQRIRYYLHAIDHVKNNPILGVGMGNWKIKSVDYDSKNMDSYIVPYHVHNDFLEITTELGIIGLCLFLFPFIYIAVIFFKNFNARSSLEFLIISMSLLIYFIDSNLNFPHARVINQLSFVLIISTFLITHERKENI